MIYSKKCIPRDWVCDNEVDCGSDPVSGRKDDSDEDPALCKSNVISCGPNQLICKVSPIKIVSWESLMQNKICPQY